MVRFVVRVVVDTLGHPEPGSLSVVQTEDSSLDAMAEGLVRVARFRPGRIHGHPVRTFVDIPVLLPASVGSTRLATVTNMVEQAPQLISGPPLVYPVGLERYGVEGQVILQAIIDTTGRAEPASLKILQSPDPAFERVALAWIKEARFRPAKLNGRPVRVLVSVPLDFRAPRR